MWRCGPWGHGLGVHLALLSYNDLSGLLQVKLIYVSMKCMQITRCFSELFLNLKTCTAAQDQKQSSSTIMSYLGIKAQERIRARKKWIEKETGQK